MPNECFDKMGGIIGNYVTGRIFNRYIRDCMPVEILYAKYLIEIKHESLSEVATVLLFDIRVLLESGQVLKFLFTSKDYNQFYYSVNDNVVDVIKEYFKSRSKYYDNMEEYEKNKDTKRN